MSPLRLIILLVAAGAAIAAVFVVRSMQAPAPAAASIAPPVIETAIPEAPPAPTVEVLVAKRAVAMGSYLTAEDLAWQAWPEPEDAEQLAAFITKANQPEGLDRAVGAVVRMPIVAGEPIIASKIVHPGEAGFMAAMLDPGMRAVSFEISAETAAGGFILPNDRVDVLVTRDIERPGSGTSSFSQRILSNVKVLAIDAIYGMPQEGQGQALIGTRATLELTEPDARTLAAADKAGDISLTLRSVADLREAPGAVHADQSNGAASGAAGVRIYRYGQPTIAAAPASGS
jgi:pilus assembly protein CpaB